MAKQVQVDEVRSATSTEDAKRAQEKLEVKKFLTQALTRFKIAAEHESKTRKESLDDWKFSMGEQWTADIQSQRVADGRPCLVMDHLKQSIRQVTNEQRQQRPAIQINPVGDGATREVADVLQGTVRHIEMHSEAEVAYDSSFEQMVRGGVGWLRVSTDWAPGMTFEQDLVISHVRNPFTVYSDPSTMKPDKTDAKWRFVIEDVARDEYKLQYPDSEANSLVDFTSIGDIASAWGSKDAIRVAEYFHVEQKKKTIVKLADGRVVEKKDAGKEEIIEERDYFEPKVMWTKHNAIEILEESEWPGTIIPVVPVLGDDIDVDGRWHLSGMVRNAKDPQRMYNYQCSAATELSALAPRAPFIGVSGQFKSRESQWKSVNQKNFAYIEYDNVLLPGNTPAPAPQRNVAEPPIQAAVALMRAAGEDLKASIGIYDASLGAPGPDQSGKAILARQKQGDVATLNYSDNLARTIRVIGRILVEAIPKIYTEPRIQRIINPDQSVSNKAIFNSGASDYAPEEALSLLQEQEKGISEVHDIGVGRYDVSVSVGPNFNSKRQEAVESIQALIAAYPEIMPIAGDLLIANMDWPYAHEISKRLKKQIPPNLIDENDQSPEAKQQQMEQQLNQTTQQLQQAQEALQQAHQIIQTKTVESNAKIEVEKIKSTTQLALAKLDREVKLAVAEVTTKAQSANVREQLEHDVFQATHDAAHELAMAKTAPPEESDQGSQSATSDNQGDGQ